MSWRAETEKAVARLEDYRRQRGVEYELQEGEVPAAVFWLKRAARAEPIQQLGQQLRDWMARQPGVRRILGLERLLDGERPEVSVTLLGIPHYLNNPEKCVEPVGLLLFDVTANSETLASSFRELVESSGIEWVTSWEEYSYMNR